MAMQQISPISARKPGRPNKLKPETLSKLVEAIEVGLTYDLACHYARISYMTFRRWLDRGGQDVEAGKSTVFSEFCEAIKSAEGRAAMKWQLKIEKAASLGDWHAAAWKLERRYPDKYGRTVQDHHVSAEMEVTQHGTVADTLKDPTIRDAALALLDRIAEHRPDSGGSGVDRKQR